MESDDDLYTLSQAINGLLERMSRDLEKDGLRPSAIRDFELYLIGIWKKEFNVTIYNYLGVELWDQNDKTIPSKEVPALIKLIEDRSYEEIEKMRSEKRLTQQAIQTQKRKRRTIKDLEILTPKVVDKYEELSDTGDYTVIQIFDKLAEKSFELFKEKLTSGQIRGIYNRREKFLQ